MSPIRMSKLESAVRVVLEFNEAFNRHDVAGMMQLMSDDCVFEETFPRRMAQCITERKQSVSFSKTSSASHRKLTSKSRRFSEWGFAV